MFFKVEKLRNRIHELNGMRYQKRKNIDQFEGKYVTCDTEKKTPPPAYTETFKRGDYWKGRDTYLWLGFTVDTQGYENPTLYMDFGRTGGGNNSGFEALLYLNGLPFQAVDCNHREVILPQGHEAFKIDILLWTGLEGGGHPTVQEYQLKEAWLSELNTEVDTFYYLSKAILDTVELMADEVYEKHALLEGLNRAFLLLNWTQPLGQAFNESVSLASQCLNRELVSRQGDAPYTVHTIGHSHIDLAWLWRIRHTKEKALRSFTTVMRLMSLDESYTYLQSQPQLYQWVKEDYPELFDQIQEKVKSGQWIPEGAMWVEADCNIPSGESLVRQLLYGKSYFKENFGVESQTLWLPDVFGYSWALPQILKKSGVDTFVTTKISWNQYNRMPHDTFKWKGIDGTEILTHFVTTPEPGRPKDAWFYTYNGLLCAETTKGIWDKYREKSINQDLLLAYGYGDGGGGVNRDMLEMKKHLNSLPTMPKVKSTDFKSYFEKLQKTFQETDQYVHVWDGELYLEYHRGTYTSQAKTKRWNRYLENRLKTVEAINALPFLSQPSHENAQKSIEKAWKKVLLNQFHDIIPGSSIQEVYDDAINDYEEVEKDLLTLTDEILQPYLEEVEKDLSVFNATQYEEGREIVLDIPSDTEVYQGEELLEQANTHDGKKIVYFPKMSAYAFHPLSLKTHPQAVLEEKAVLAEIDLKSRCLQTPLYTLKWNDSGQWTSLFDHKAQREMLSGLGNVFKLYEDKPMAHEAWDIDLFYIEKCEVIDKKPQIEILENNALRAVLAFKWDIDQISLEQKICFYRHSKRIDCVTDANWQARQKLLKVEFPLAIRSHETLYDIQFGNVKRPNHWNTSWDMAKFESVGHHWAAQTEADYGIALLNDCKYGYSSKDNVIALSLLKGSTHPDPHADLGHQKWTYALMSFEGMASKHQLAQEGIYLNTPILSTKGKVKGLDKWIHVEDKRVVIDAIKVSEKGKNLILRCHEMEGSSCQAKIAFDLPGIQWREVSLMETGENPWHDHSIEVTFKPYEIKTFEIIGH